MPFYKNSLNTYPESSSRDHSTPRLSRMDLDLETSRGISFKQFLKHALCLTNEEFKNNLSQARRWLSETSVLSKFDDFKSKAQARDARVTQAFIDFGNAVLATAMNDYCVPEERQIKMLLTQTTNVDEVTPDVSIVHISVDRHNITQRRRLDWRRVLGSFQVWYAKEATLKKRSQDPKDRVSEEPPSKRSKSPTVKEPSSSVLLTDSQNRQNHPSDQHSDLGDPKSSTRDLSESKLCEETAEGELVGSFTSMFSAHGDRTHATGGCLYGTIVKLMLASHTGIIESNEVDLEEEPELFAVFLSSFATSSFADIGFNSKTGFLNPCNVDDIVTRRLGVGLEKCVLDNNQGTQPCLNTPCLGEKIVSQKGLVNRATSVYHLDNTNYGIGLVLKYSWQVKTHRREDTVIREARQADAVHTPELFGTAVVDDPSPFETLRNACNRKSKRHEPRELRVLVIRMYRPLTELGFGEEFWDVFGQLLGCSHDLYKKKMILHHDISMKNLAYYREDGGRAVGVLIDFDLATMPPLEQTDSPERIGTVAFMAHEHLLYPENKYGLHHDLESFFYCAIWHGLGYDTCEKYPLEEEENTDILYYWRVGDYRTMAYHKVALSPDKSAFRRMQDKEFSRKCIKLLEVFDETMAVKRLEGYKRICVRRLKSGVVHSGEVPGSKLTYSALMEALGLDRHACVEDCCT